MESTVLYMGVVTRLFIGFIHHAELIFLLPRKSYSLWRDESLLLANKNIVHSEVVIKK